MPILNYTTTVPVSRTIGQVQGLLVEAGARSILTNYDDVGRAIGIGFAVQTAHGSRTYTVPVNAKRDVPVAHRWLKSGHCEERKRNG